MSNRNVQLLPEEWEVLSAYQSAGEAFADGSLSEVCDRLCEWGLMGNRVSMVLDKAAGVATGQRVYWVTKAGKDALTP